LVSDQAEASLVTPAAERALGLAAHQLLGAGWLEVLVSSEQLASARWQLQLAQAGAARNITIGVTTGMGPALARFEARLVGRSGWTLLVLEDLALRPAVSISGDYDYEVSCHADRAPQLRKTYRLGVAAQATSGDCFRVLHGASAPCSSCPLDERAPLQAVRRDELTFELLSANAAAEGLMRISVRAITQSQFTALRDARLRELAARARLSEREREVLTLLVSGAPLDEIASQIGIGLRTVKFHQSNVLNKLGADSRADLARLIF
jgi:DNA-binding CsgD family transcriptional regulator